MELRKGTDIDAVIDLSGLGHPPEFRSHAWVRLEDMPQHIVEWKRDVYLHLVDVLGPIIGARCLSRSEQSAGQD